MNRLLGLYLVFAASVSAGDLQLTLPPVVYATPDVPISIYDDNIVLTQTPENYRFEFTCKLGRSEARRWTLTPVDADVGDHPLAVTVKDASGKILEQGKTTLRVSPRKAGAGKPLRLLIIGDSLTHASLYPNEIARLLAQPGNPRSVLLGTHKPADAQPGVAHEGYGGWKWADFLIKYTAPTPGATAGPLARKATSPFIFPSSSGKTGKFDLDRYFKEHCDNEPPDIVTFLLGINDCFGANPTKPDAKIDEVLDNADKLLAAFHKAAPKAILAVGLTTPPNTRQEAFTANYKNNYSRWGWKRIQHRLVQRMLERLANREKDGIHLVPTELNLDPTDGYPANNSVHPNPAGYAQVGASFYAWMKSRWQ
ncbi:MAG: SGNH/GDSL hydrolase family protein [Verrucomicrobiaceae bacterium]|nr:SGNH/GDSL hydrolase family protein [Verrucomicrobiaceae bacterium]